MENYTYMTLLTNNTYVQGVILLNETLKKVKSKYPLIVLVTEEVAQATLDILDYLKIKWKLVDTIQLPDYIENFKQNQYQKHKQFNPLWKNTITKYQIFNQIEYEKIIFLDCDIMILRNIDHLFQVPSIGATKLLDNSHFTSGLLIISPSIQLFNNFINFIQCLSLEEVKNLFFDSSDQKLFEYFLLNNKQYKINFINNKLYNVFIFPEFVSTYQEQILKRSYCIHFQGEVKPWDYKNQLFKNPQNINLEFNNSGFKYEPVIKIIKDTFDTIPKNLMINFISQYGKELIQYQSFN